MSSDFPALPRSQPTPAEDREARRAAMSRRFRSAALDVDVSLVLLARALGVPASHVSRYCDPEDDTKHLGAADVEALPPLMRRELVSYWAGTLGCVLADLPAEESFAGDLATLSRVVKESADVAAKYAAALEDQHIDPVEAEQLMAEAMDAIAALQTLHRRCSQAVRERGVRLVGATK